MNATVPAVASAHRIVEMFTYLIINKVYTLAYSIVLFYDHLLTLAAEVKYVWNRKFTPPTYIFFVFRYFPPFVCILNTIAEHNPTWMSSQCERWVWVPVSLGPIIAATTGVILIMRARALHNNAHWVLFLAVPFYLFRMCVMIWSIPAGASLALPEGFVGCIPSQREGTIARLYVNYVSAVAFDAVIFALTVARAIQLRLRSAIVPLVSLILRDGAVYFLALFSINLLNVFLLLKVPEELSIPNARFSNLITSILVSRLLFNLRAQAEEAAQSQSNFASSPFEKSIRFSTNIDGWSSVNSFPHYAYAPSICRTSTSESPTRPGDDVASDASALHNLEKNLSGTNTIKPPGFGFSDRQIAGIITNQNSSWSNCSTTLLNPMSVQDEHTRVDEQGDLVELANMRRRSELRRIEMKWRGATAMGPFMA